MFGEIDNLADMIRVMRDLTCDCLHRRVILSANRDGAEQVVRRQRLDCVEGALPALLPIGEHIFFRGLRQHDEFDVAIAFRLLAIGSEKIGPARDHVAGHVLHDHRDAVRFVVDRAKEVFVIELCERPLSKLLVFAKRVQHVLEIVLAE
jgi:hypothetical protein